MVEVLSNSTEAGDSHWRAAVLAISLTQGDGLAPHCPCDIGLIGTGSLPLRS